MSANRERRYMSYTRKGARMYETIGHVLSSLDFERESSPCRADYESGAEFPEFPANDALTSLESRVKDKTDGCKYVPEGRKRSKRFRFADCIQRFQRCDGNPTLDITPHQVYFGNNLVMGLNQTGLETYANWCATAALRHDMRISARRTMPRLHIVPIEAAAAD